MLNYFKLFLLLLFFVNSLYALDNQTKIQLTDEEKAYLVQHPVIKAQNEKNWPPFNFEEKGIPKGFSIDFMNLLAQKLGVKVEYVSGYSWAEYMKMLQSPKLDVIINISKNKERAKTISFTDVFYTSQNAIYVHSKKPRFDKVEQLINKTIAMPKGFFAQKFIEKHYPKIKQVLVSDQLEALKLLSLGKVDATIGKKVVMDYIIAHNNISGVTPTGFIEDKRAISLIRLGTSKKDTILRDILQKAMDQVSDTEINQLKNKWFGIQEKTQEYKLQLTDQELEYIHTKKTLRVSNEINFPPFDFMVGDKPHGYSIDLLNMLAKRIGININYINGYQWTELVEMFQKGELDLLHTLSETPTRKEFGIFSKPYKRYQSYFITRKENSDINDIIELKGKVVAVGRGWSVHEYLKKKYPDIKLLVLDDLEEMIEAVSNGKAYALINDKFTSNYLIKKMGVDNLKISKMSKKINNGKSKMFHFMAQKDAQVLISIINKAYDSLTAKDLDMLNNKWFAFEKTDKELENTIPLTLLEKKYLQKKQKINMCIDPNWIPFESFDEKGNYEGMSADYYRIFAQMLPVKFEVIQTKSWNQSLDFIKTKECDILSLVSPSSEKQKYLNFTKPYVNLPIVLVTQIDTPFINDIKLLKNKKIGVLKKATSVELIKEKYKNFDIIEIESVKEGLKKVEREELFGFVGNIISVGKLIQSDFSGVLKVSSRLEEEIQLSIGVRDDDTLLLQILQKAIDNLSSIKKHEILNKWISIKYEKGVDYTVAWVVLLVLFIVIIVFSYKQYRLKESIEEMGELIDATMEAIFISQGGICIDVNQSAVELFGYNSKEEMIGIPLTNLVAEDTKYTVEQNLRLDDVLPYEGNAQRKDGQIFPALIRGHNLKSNPFRISSVVEITHLKQLEAQNKLASMGEMIGNIAHQWRQPLNNTFLYLQFLKDTCNPSNDELIDKYFNRCFNQVQYMSQTIDDFTDFLKDEKKPVYYLLENNIQKFLKIIESTIKSNNINISVQGETHISLLGFPNELNQCFINIFNNSKDAFLEKNLKKCEKHVFIDLKVTDDKAVISFKDNAGGIKEDILPHIFEPYYTTKHQSKGTGLGLSMTYNLIIDSMHGNIKVQNVHYEYKGVKYKGAEFIITIPLQIVAK